MAVSTGAAILGSSIIGGGLGLLGSKEQSSAAKRAAESQVAAGDRATQAQLEMYYQSRKDLAPWRLAGERSLADLEREQGLYADVVHDPNLYKESPGYGWLQQEGIEALSRGASAAGKLGSGQYSKDLLRFGQGLALQDYSGYLGRLESLMNRYAGTAQVGQTASGTLANLGQQTGTNLGNIYTGMGQAQAGGYINQANARTGLYSNLANIGSNAMNQYMLYNYLGNLGGGGSGYQLPADIAGWSNPYA